jgi:spermidine/putrescine transport system substrate-binding protein
LLAVILILAGLAGCGAPPPAPSTPTPPPLAEIDYRNVPNFKNISANFRDLTYDPGNRHTIPYTWGTTGLVVRSDLAAEPVTHWADLWDTRYAGRVAIWDLPRHSLGLALKSF